MIKFWIAKYALEKVIIYINQCIVKSNLDLRLLKFVKFVPGFLVTQKFERKIFAVVDFNKFQRDICQLLISWWSFRGKFY